MTEPDDSVVHLAGVDVQFTTEAGVLLRQRCSWCGTTLIDINLANIAVPVGQNSSYPTWRIGALVETYSPDNRGGVWAEVDWEPGTPVPANACMRMHPELTS